MFSRVHRAFTLVELVMVIVIIGLLAAVITPQFTDMRDDAENAAETATVAAVRTGIKMVRMSNLAKNLDEFPTTLDSAANGEATNSNPLFTEVVENGLTDSNWKKTGKRSYQYVPTKTTYTYSTTTGEFAPKTK
ncbi:MAG: prepilin-type N-terminal cleavage/methylation domain-containing protein [Phycisphaerae bacterium]|nr:prepilin-type N-terminal cleavage/methylation domain-containing protein [Phycisphaerae bacterium]